MRAKHETGLDTAEEEEGRASAQEGAPRNPGDRGVDSSASRRGTHELLDTPWQTQTAFRQDLLNLDGAVRDEKPLRLVTLSQEAQSRNVGAWAQYDSQSVEGEEAYASVVAWTEKPLPVRSGPLGWWDRAANAMAEKRNEHGLTEAQYAYLQERFESAIGMVKSMQEGGSRGLMPGQLEKAQRRAAWYRESLDGNHPNKPFEEDNRPELFWKE